MYTTPVVASASWFDARIICSFSYTRDVFPNDLVLPKCCSCLVRVYCAV